MMDLSLSKELQEYINWQIKDKENLIKAITEDMAINPDRLNSVMKNTNSCLSCEFFRSFHDEYDDNMEPEDQGICKNTESERFGNNGAGENVLCDLHKATGKKVMNRQAYFRLTL